jgi:ribonucleoside-diphosphate reductase beta chain
MSIKKILSGDLAIVNQLRPSIYPWAYDLFLKGQANNWVPNEVQMSKDIEQWKAKDVLTDDERLLLKRCLGFFAGSESLVANNLLLGIFRVVSDAECRQYIIRQTYEEAVHNQTIAYISDSLGLDVQEIYEAYKLIPSIKAKDDFLMSITSDMGRPGFDVTTPEGKREAIRNLISFYVICEGIFFYSGFAMLLSFGRQGKMPGIAEQIQYSIRDESNHVLFGISLISTIIEQEPEIWNEEFQNETVEHVRKATELEIAYAKDVLPRGVLGLNAEMFIEYMQFIANRRLGMLWLPTLFTASKNPFMWMTETIDLGKQKNFFETRVTEYSIGIRDDFDD